MQALQMQCAVVAAAAPAPRAFKAGSGSLAPAGRTATRRQHRRASGAQQQLRAAAGRQAVRVVAVAAAPEVDVREEKLEGCGMRLHISVPAELCRKQYTKVMQELRQGTTVDGYRKGKAPDRVLIEHVGGIERVHNSVLSELLEPVVSQAMRAYEAVAVPESEFIEQNAEELEKLFNIESGFTFSVRFDAVPPLTWKTPYSELQVAVESAGDEAGDEAAVEEKLLSLRKSQAKLRVVADRGLQRGDLAIVDFKASRADTGEELVGAQRQSMRLDTDDADYTFLPGIVEIITSMKPGEEKTAPLTFPTDETFQPATLRGVEASVTVKMTELFQYELPELTDEWANTLLPGEGVAGLKQRLLENQQAEREQTTRERIADAFTAAVGRAVECDIPDSLLNELGSQQYSASLNKMMSQGQLTWETVQQLATPELAKQFVASRRDELLELQRSLLGFEDIALKEGLKPTEAEIETEFRDAVRQFSQYGQQYDAEKLREQVFETVQANKVMNWLIQNCKVNMLPAGQA